MRKKKEVGLSVHACIDACREFSDGMHASVNRMISGPASCLRGDLSMCANVDMRKHMYIHTYR
jgi:hypothetical protein